MCVGESVCVCVFTSAFIFFGLDGENMEERPHATGVSSEVGQWALTAHPLPCLGQGSVWDLTGEQRSQLHTMAHMEKMYIID